MRFELTTLTLARLCSTPELRPHSKNISHHRDCAADNSHYTIKIKGYFKKTSFACNCGFLR